MSTNKMREEMIQSFIDALEDQRIPWHCCWSKAGKSYNASTGSIYRGINQMWLSFLQEKNKYEDSRWCTYKQAVANGWNIRKGEKGSKVEFWSLYDKQDKCKLSYKEANELRKKIGDEQYAKRVTPIVSNYTVFNGEQIEGIPAYTIQTYELNQEEILPIREKILTNMGLALEEGGYRACYIPSEDCLHMPFIKYFQDDYSYLSTFLHEASHASGHDSRLNRNISNGFGTPDYAKEELRAEISSAFTSKEIGLDLIDELHLENHTAYIQSWIGILRNEPNELFAAIKDAEKISDYILEMAEVKVKAKDPEETKEVEQTLERKEVKHGKTR